MTQDPAAPAALSERDRLAALAKYGIRDKLDMRRALGANGLS
ncbi:hypothetical protein [Methylobacterium sp. J-092]|nr:hypothetical protein [Methylobacterium sp. J-092]